MDKTELQKLQAFIRRAFGNALLKVAHNAKDPDSADMRLGERRIGGITVDDEDGDRSFSLDLKLPVERPVLEDYIRKLFDNDKLRVVTRARKTDSVEINNGDEFLGVASVDDPKGRTFTLQMAILDFDLEDV